MAVRSDFSESRLPLRDLDRDRDLRDFLTLNLRDQRSNFSRRLLMQSKSDMHRMLRSRKLSRYPLSLKKSFMRQFLKVLYRILIEMASNGQQIRNKNSGI